MISIPSSTPVDKPSFIHLREAGVSLLLELDPETLPSVLHWGSDLGPLDVDAVAALALAAKSVVGVNDADVPASITLPIEARTSFAGRPGVSGSRQGHHWSPAFRMDSVVVERDPGTAAPQEPEAGSLVDADAGTVTVRAVDDEAQLRLELTIRLEPSGLVRVRACLTNDGAPYQLQELVLALPVPDRAVELLDFAGRWGRERVPQRSPFTVGTHLREGRKGRTGADAATVLHAGTSGFGFAEGEIWAVHTGWSGNHLHYAESTFHGLKVLGGGELLLPGEVTLGHGESYTSPWLFAVHGQGLDEVANRFHGYQRSRPRAVDTRRPITLNVWEAVYFDHDTDRLLDLAERAAHLGVERYVLDDGWFGSRRDDFSGLGDWVVSQEVWPDGLHPLVDRVTELGMQFGLWFEPEMVNLDSDVARAHPDWVMAARTEPPVPSRHQHVLNLGIPECYEYILGQMSAILSEYDISYIKWDHNRDLTEAGNQRAGGAPGVHEQTLATYRLMAELRRRFPALEIESCSSGGARVDLGVLDHTDRIWVSDCIDPLERQSMLRWTGQLVPPEYLGSHIASGRSHTTGRTHDLNFRAATAIFGHLGIEWDLAQASDRALSELGAWISFYKEQRDLLLSGTLIRMDHAGDGAWVHGVVSPDRSRALFAYVMMASPLASPGPRFQVRGLDADADYVVRPRLIGAAPSGLLAPAWWGTATDARGSVDPGHPDASLHQAASYPGASFSGATLMSTGVVPPRLHPDQVVLFELHRA